jgi:DNA-binding NtrC family response regulator
MKGTILIVEDYADWRELLSELIRHEGYQVEAVASFEAAQDYLKKNNDLDVAILDIRLMETNEANEDGLRLLTILHDRQPFTRVIMITGYGTMEIQRKAFREFGAFDFFRKEEFNSDEFRKSVQDGVEAAARERQASKGKDYISGQRYKMWQRKIGSEGSRGPGFKEE